MFTQLGFKFVAKFLPPPSSFNILPFVVDVKKRSLSLNPSKKALACRLLLLFLELAYLSYNIVRLYLTGSGTPDPTETVGEQTTHVTMHIIMGLKYGLGAGIMLNVFFMGPAMVSTFNEMVRLETLFKGHIKKDSSYKESKVFERVAFFFFFVSMNSPVTFAFLFLTLPNEHCYIYSLFPSEYKSYYTFGLFMAIEVFSSFKSIKSVCFYFMYFTIGVSFTAHWTKVLASEKLSPKLHMKLYQQLEVFNIQYNNSYHRLLLPFIVAIGGSFNIMSLFGALRFYGTVSLGAYMVYPVLILNSASFIGLIMVLSAKIHEGSSSFMDRIKAASVRTSSVDKELLKKIRNLRPFGVRALPYRNYENISILVYSSAIVDNTISLLMAYPATV